MEEKSDNENNCRRPLHSELSSDCASGRLQHTDLSKAKASISQYLCSCFIKCSLIIRMALFDVSFEQKINIINNC